MFVGQGTVCVAQVTLSLMRIRIPSLGSYGLRVGSIQSPVGRRKPGVQAFYPLVMTSIAMENG